MDVSSIKKMDDFKDYFCRKCGLRNVEVKYVADYTEYADFCDVCPIKKFVEDLKYEL